MTTTPPLVARARAAAAALGRSRDPGDEDGPLLHVLAARRGVERVAATGAGAGLGAAWIAAALPPGVPLFVAEADAILATSAEALFRDDHDVHVLAGDWRDVLPPEAPFDLVLADDVGAGDDLEALLAVAAPGATLVRRGGAADRVGLDPGRERWLCDARVAAVEVGIGGIAGAIVAVVNR